MRKGGWGRWKGTRGLDRGGSATHKSTSQRPSTRAELSRSTTNPGEKQTSSIGSKDPRNEELQTETPPRPASTGYGHGTDCRGGGRHLEGKTRTRPKSPSPRPSRTRLPGPPSASALTDTPWPKQQASGRASGSVERPSHHQPPLGLTLRYGPNKYDSWKVLRPPYASSTPFPISQSHPLNDPR